MAHLGLLITNRGPGSAREPVGLVLESKRSSRRTVKEGLRAVPKSHSMHSGII